MPSYSGLFNGVYGTDHTLLSNTVNKQNAETLLSKLFSRRVYSRGATAELLATLVSGAVGDTASLSHKRVEARQNLSQNVQGGLVPIETFEDVNRATTADDVTELNDAFTMKSSPTYTADKGGNGGGGKLGY